MIRESECQWMSVLAPVSLMKGKALAASFYFELSSLLCAVISELVGHCGGSRSVKPSKWGDAEMKVECCMCLHPKDAGSFLPPSLRLLSPFLPLFLPFFFFSCLFFWKGRIGQILKPPGLENSLHETALGRWAPWAGKALRTLAFTRVLLPVLLMALMQTDSGFLLPAQRTST